MGIRDERGLEATAPSDPALDATGAADPGLDATAAPDPALDATVGSGDPALGATASTISPIATATSTAVRGQTLGRFVVVNELGHGGMGVVLAAFDPELDRKVAIKLLRSDVSGAGTEGRTRLMREAQAMAKLAHPNVVTVFEVGLASDQVFIAMEFVDGGTLTRWLSQSRSQREILDMFLGAATGLAAAHAAGLVHRDFKPDNVLVGKDGRPRVSDFGLVGGAIVKRAETSSAPVSNLTATGAVMGTPIYMAPEQFLGEATDARTDQFSFCVALYEALSGHRPFSGDTFHELEDNVVGGKLRESNGRIPAWLRAVLLRGLAADPAARFPSIDDLVAALRADPSISRRRRRIAAAAAVALLAGSGIAGYAVWRSQRVVVEDCANYALRWEVPVCVGTLGADARTRAETRWQLRSQHGRVFEVSRLNAHDELVDDKDGIARIEFRYAGSGRVHEAISLDQFGEVVKRALYSDTLDRVETRDRNQNPLAFPGTDITTELIDLDESGKRTRSRFVNIFGSPRPGLENQFGVRYEYESHDLVARMQMLGPDAAPRANRLGIAALHYEYNGEGVFLASESRDVNGHTIGDAKGIARYETDVDEYGNILRERLLDRQGKPAPGSVGCFARAFKRSEWGEPIEVACLSGSGAPMRSSEGFVTLRTTWDDRGSRIEDRYVDGSGAPDYSGGVSIVRWELDQNRRRLTQRFFDPSGKPMVGKDGYAYWKRSYDEHGHITSEAYWGIDDKPIAAAQGIAAIHRKYDSRGLVIEDANLGADGEPSFTIKGCAVMRFEYDEHGKRAADRCLDGERKPAVRSDGYSVLRFEYDREGRQTSESYLDVQERPTIDRRGGASIRIGYDDRGYRNELAWLGLDGQLTSNVDHTAVETTTHDERGNPNVVTTLDTERKPVANANGYATWRRTSDERGREIKIEFFAADGKPALSRDLGFASYTIEYDDRGFITAWAGFGTDGRPLIGKEGWARHEVTRDDRGLAVEHRYLGVDGAPIISNLGSARWRIDYDVRGNVIGRAMFDVAGKPVISRHGYASMRSVVDPLGHVLEERFFDTDGHPVIAASVGAASTWFRYDALGSKIDGGWRDTDGRPMLGPDGVARMTSKYDRDGNEIERVGLGIDDQPKTMTTGYARYTARFDHRHNQTEIAYFGPDGSPAVDSSSGLSRIESTFDTQGHRLGGAGFGVDGKPKAWSDGYARWTAAYDARGNRTEERYFDGDGKPILASTGIAGWQATYDQAGRLVEKRAFGLDGSPRAWSKTGYSRWTSAFDSRGDNIEVAYFRVDGSLLFRNRRVFDAAGHEIEARYVDAQEKPTLWQGIAGYRSTLDDRGRTIEIMNRGIDGGPAKVGVAYERTTFDDRDNVVDTVLLDARMQPAVDTSLGMHATHRVYDIDNNQLVRSVSIDALGHPVLGRQRDANGVTNLWRAKGDTFEIANRDFVSSGKQVDPALASRIRAAIHADSMQRRGATEPGLFDGARGVLVIEMSDNGAGAKAGIRTGDVLVALDGQKLNRPSEVAPILLAAKVPLALVLVRDGVRVSITLQPGRQGLVLDPL